VVPQQNAWVVERLGRFHASLLPGLNIIIPFFDRIAYKHMLKEVPLDVPSQVCITKDNTQLQVDGILYFQVTDPKLASYGTSNYIMAITQLAQTTLRSVIGKMELDKTFEERDDINRAVVAALDEAATSWGVKVLRYEIKDLTPPKEITASAQITAERERLVPLRRTQAGTISIATGEREALSSAQARSSLPSISPGRGRATGGGRLLPSYHAGGAGDQSPGGMTRSTSSGGEVCRCLPVAKEGNTDLQATSPIWGDGTRR
jgi:regulator of protease activity HflC (stomatin/prohibitin superfamily)